MSAQPPRPDLSDIREELGQALGATGPLTAREHAEQLTVVSALVCSAFRRVGLWAVLVGGGVIEVYAPGAYTTFDIDLVISRHGVAPRRDELDAVFRALGFAKQAARHWTRGEVLIEVPGWEVDDPTEELRIGPHVLEMVCKEAVLVGRLVEYEQTGHTGHTAQAILMLRVLGEALNRERLDQLVAREHVEDAYAAAREFAAWPPERHITNMVLQEARDRWQAAMAAAGRRSGAAEARAHAMKLTRWDIRILRSIWAERAAAVERAKQSIDTRDMTRPPRDPAERAWLEAHGLEGPFFERPPVAPPSAAPASRRTRRR